MSHSEPIRAILLTVLLGEERYRFVNHFRPVISRTETFLPYPFTLEVSARGDFTLSTEAHPVVQQALLGRRATLTIEIVDVEAPDILKAEPRSIEVEFSQDMPLRGRFI